MCRFWYSRALVLPFLCLPLVFLSSGCGGKKPALTAGETNVLLIMIDTLRPDHLGSYGYAKDTSPSLDRLAREGILVKQCISQSPWTRPSVATIVTSTYPPTHGIAQEMFDALPAGLLTLAEFLRGNGYRTLGYTANPNLNPIFGFDQGFETYRESLVVFDWMHDLETVPDDAPTGLERFMSAKMLTDLVLRDVENLSPPFYLQVFYMDPHYPYTPPPEYLGKFGKMEPRDRYDGEIAFTDAQISRLVEKVRASFPNTLIVITSDHGEGFNENNDSILNRFHGNFLYQTTVHVPLIFSHPSLPAEQLDGIFELIDLFPTIAELLGFAPPDGLEGTSLARKILAGQATGKEFAYMETGWRGMRKAGIISRGWKYIANTDFGIMNEIQKKRGQEPYFVPEELYDIFSPRILERPGENISPGRPEVLDSLRTRLAAFQRNFTPRREQPMREIDLETEKQLKALGYLGGDEQ
jgi:arylsulfatase A-like enzyme